MLTGEAHMKRYTLYELDGRLILGHGPHAGTIKIIDAPNWKQARRKAIRMPEVDAYDYKPRCGWERRQQ